VDQGGHTEPGRRGGLTPEQRAERFSTSGLDFQDSLQFTLAGGRGEDEQATDEGQHSREAERELTDDELLARIEDAERQLEAGSANVFYDEDSLLIYWTRRPRE
jgi:hypothetical protein